MSNDMEKSTEQSLATIDDSLKQDADFLSIEMVDKERKIAYIITPKVELNFENLAKSGYLTPDTMQGNLAEKYRIIKHSLLWNTSQTNISITKYNSNLTMITSALSGEGKTYTSFNLAMSIVTELNDTNVLLVDCDLVGRSLTRLAGLNYALGLTNVLLDSRVSLSQVIVPTNISKLRLIPVGTCRRNIELLTIKKLWDVAHELSTSYSDHIVLFDTMPLLSNSQILPLTSLVGKILVVVEEGKTPQVDIKKAISLLEQNKMIGLILNKCSWQS